MWGILVKILQRRQRAGHFLNLIEDEQVIGWVYATAYQGFQACDDGLRVDVAGEHISEPRVLIEVEINGLLKMRLAKLPHQPGLTYLSGTFDYQRLSAVFLLPVYKFAHQITLHSCSSLRTDA
jgi:hypothetical protein